MKKAWLILVAIGLLGCGEKEKTSWEKTTPKSLSGMIRLHPDLVEKVTSSDVLFVMARGQSGPPIAVKKLRPQQFPIRYTLSEEEDLMLPGMVFPDELYVSARIDKDGNASPPQPGDLGGEYTQNPAKVGSTHIDIEINKVY